MVWDSSWAQSLAWGLVWNSECSRVQGGVRPGHGEHFSLNSCDKYFGHTNKGEGKKTGKIRDDLLV